MAKKKKARYKRVSRSPSLSTTQNGAWQEALKEPSLLYRPYYPKDVFEIGALRKAILMKFDAVAMDPQGSSSLAQRTLTHILNCWDANISWNHEIKRCQCAGPSFLIHILSGCYGAHELSFDSLKGDDERLVSLLRECCAETEVFFVLLAQIRRTAYACGAASAGAPQRSEVGIIRVTRTECTLENIVHSGGRMVKVYPKISEDDLLNEWYFEDQDPDSSVNLGSCWEQRWERTVLIIVPTKFADEFFGYHQQELPQSEGFDALDAKELNHSHYDDDNDMEHEHDENELFVEDEEVYRSIEPESDPFEDAGVQEALREHFAAHRLSNSQAALAETNETDTVMYEQYDMMQSSGATHEVVDLDMVDHWSDYENG